LIALAFAASAAAKLTGVATPMFAHWGYPAWFATLIGALELMVQSDSSFPEPHVMQSWG
jgi:hypothetical protein